MPDPNPPPPNTDPAVPAPEAGAQTGSGLPSGLLQASIAATVSSQQAADQAARQQAAMRDDLDRSRIGRRIIDLFVGVVAIVLLLLLFQALGSKDWPTAASQAADLLKTAVVPIVTLVLGYYFGKSGKL